MKSHRFSTLRLCTIGMMIAVYFVLAKLTIIIGSLRITLASLPIVVLAVLYGPVDASIAALLGEFMIQAMGSYGITPTTPLWCLPPVLRALTVGTGFRFIARYRVKGAKVFTKAFNVCVILGAMLTTVGNTLVWWIDSIINHYNNNALIFGQFFIRLITGVIEAILIANVTLPVQRAVTELHIRIK